MGFNASDIKAAEEMIRRIQDVNEVKIINENGAITEIHILACAGRGVKQIVRDVETVCTTSFGKAVDHKKISVAQLGNDDDFSGNTRLKIIKTGIILSNREVEVNVSLANGDEVHTARVSGRNTIKNRITLMVEAGLKCISSLIGECVLVLDRIRKVEIDGEPVVLVVEIGHHRVVKNSFWDHLL